MSRWCGEGADSCLHEFVSGIVARYAIVPGYSVEDPGAIPVVQLLANRMFVIDATLDSFLFVGRGKLSSTYFARMDDDRISRLSHCSYHVSEPCCVYASL